MIDITRPLAALVAAALLPVPALAQPKPLTTYDRAIAAGYKALMLCGAIFNGGRTQAQAEALELTGTYPEYDALLPKLNAVVAHQITGTATVTVSFDEALEPRIASYRQGKGCTIAPIRPVEIILSRPPKPVTPTPPINVPADTQSWLVDELRKLPKPKTPKPLATALDGELTNPRWGANTRTTAMLVLKNGQIVAERYAAGFTPHTSQRTWSVAKSINATIIGVLANRGALTTDQPAGIPEWQKPGDPRQAITIDNLLRMASGLHSATAGNRTDAIYFGGTTVREEATAWPLEAKPGTRFRYANNDTMLAAHAVNTGLGEEGALAPVVTEVFQILGMTRTVAETDWQGNYILSSQVFSTARDLARFGLFYLNEGVVGDERLLPRGWIEYVTRPSGPQPEGEFGYGAGFWLMSKSPGVPADTYAAFGNRGQYVVIVPSRKTVIVRRGEDPAGARFDIAKFTADVLAALN